MLGRSRLKLDILERCIYLKDWQDKKLRIFYQNDDDIIKTSKIIRNAMPNDTLSCAIKSP